LNALYFLLSFSPIHVLALKAAISPCKVSFKSRGSKKCYIRNSRL